MSQAYKDSIQLPKTSFPMKARLPQTEPQRIEMWQKNQVYQKMLKATDTQAQPFILPDGPPYANGALHIGHVLNKVLKDIILKYKNMSGQRAPFVPGWDCHGLPIELKVSKKKSGLSPAELRQACRNEALKWIEKQKQQFIRLGVLADWQKPYLTMQPHYEAHELRVLARLIDKGLVYQGQKPVHWCPKLRTALSASEVEHRSHKSQCVFVKFEATQKVFNKNVAFAVWTTTPWTLPANQAVCLNKNIDYGLFEFKGEVILMAVQLYAQLQKHKPQWPANLKPVQVCKGRELKNLKLKHPFLEREVPVLFGSHVTDDTGTGCVHTAPGHGLDDYNIGLKYKLPMESPVDERGRYNEQAPDFLQGQQIVPAQSLIVERMKSTGHLIAEHSLEHSYPYNPRTNSPMIFRCTRQWFVSLDKGLRQKALQSLDDIHFVPSWGRQRMQSMLENAPDWCLSRQRVWGVPLPVLYCVKCKAALLNSKVVQAVADAVEASSEGIEVYHQRPASEFGQGLKCSQCQGSEFEKGRDILDVWFDSGTCHTGVQKSHAELQFPAQCYLEGSDQHRGWFFTSLLSSLGAYDTPPYKELITHGFVNDAQGHKMSKSAGNVVDPEEVIRQSGAEILRLWVACEDYGQDINLSKQTFQRVSEAYRRWRNVFRFLLGNLHDFNFTRDKVEFKNLTLIDKWCLLTLDRLVTSVTIAYNEYAFHRVYHEINAFMTSHLSALYLDVLKDRLYTAKANGPSRRSAQTVFYYLLQTLTPMVAPILSFLAEEVFEHMQQLPGNTSRGDATSGRSVFELDFPKPKDWEVQKKANKVKYIIQLSPLSVEDLKQSSRPVADAFVMGWEAFLELRRLAFEKIEKLRAQNIIGSSLEARVVMKILEPEYSICKKYLPELKELLIVSQLEIEKKQPGSAAATTTDEGLISEPIFEVEVAKAEGQKCVRCWHYSTQIGPKYPDVCPKCVEALS